MILVTLFWLLFAHFLADYSLQNDWIAKKKISDNYILLVHSFIWGGTVSLFLGYFGILMVWKVIFLIIGHFIMDYIKCRSKKDIWIIDQLVHFLQVLIILI